MVEKQFLRPGGNTTCEQTPKREVMESDFRIDDATLDSWKQVQLASTDALLTAAIHDPQNPPHPILASRALVRARLQQWDAALVDAETVFVALLSHVLTLTVTYAKAINIQPSVIGYIAKSIAHVGMGEIHKAYQACDIAFEHFHSSHGTFILLVKAIIVSKAGQHRDAISQVDNLIATAYMYLLLGNSQMERCEFTAARQSFERALTHIQHHTSQALFVVSLISGWKFDNLDVTIRQRLCEALYAAGRTKDAVEYFYQIPIEFREVTNLHDEHLHWVLDFSQRSSKELEHLGDTALGFQQYDDAISLYTTALSLNPPSPLGILIKRGKAFLATGSWKQALDDANQVITLDPSSPSGYEVKHAASHKAGDYDTAVDAFEVMLSKIAQSPNPDIQRLGDQYNSPSSTRATIRKIVQRTIRHLPRVLINTTTGRLHERAEQASTFEAVSIFNELVSSMTTRIDYVRIKREVRHYFRFVMLSHRWEENEPLFHQVIQIAVYELDTSPTHDKLQTFCKIVRDAGFNWAWSDTCCIDKKDHFVLQEALVAMFKWYRSSAMMIVFLRGVRSSSQRGALAENVWNKRGWTLQEYIASKVIHFYTEDWTLYLNLQLPNHKESPEIISEMEKATGVSAQQLIAVRPGLSSIREKLRLASTRQTTMLEDAAYSLLGIFSVTGLPTIYGAGEGALGRLLALILAGSGDVRILAWTGESGSYNSCLPAHITVFKELATSHLPTPIPDVGMESIITTSQSSSFDLDVALRLYNRLNELPAPWFAESRMKLPCIAFQLPPFSQSLRTRSGRIQVYRADTDAFGMVEIKTRHDLSRMKSLYLVHPWLDTLLEREDKSNVMVEEDDVGRPPSPSTDDEEDTDDDSASLPELDSPSQPAHARMAPMDKETQARRLVAHLGQPFGALLVASASTGGRAVDYKRVAADSIITVRFQTNVSLADILDNVRTLDVL
ncbi:TPR-like protein [Imleria badia]|nr:TPR-like protein [Imleria badia]